MSTLLLFDSLSPNEAEHTRFRIEDPAQILQCSAPVEIMPLLERVDEYARAGKWVAGFITYEAGCALLPGIPAAIPRVLPYAWFAVCDAPDLSPQLLPHKEIQVEHPLLDVNLEEYRRNVAIIK